ncbi:hypothetical protein B5807_10846 [Epicoccum nigrum]|uniref:Uncharacterized protein n=1 Tax=Epicoccum nigrum TaxID=105696 RepID=A0A1Y2LL76_EPING|nr:hypothetical protein B5807_10846 [Epicoccum nigrum]
MQLQAGIRNKQRRHLEDQDEERDETQQLQNKLLAAGSALNPCDIVISPVSPYPSAASASIGTVLHTPQIGFGQRCHPKTSKKCRSKKCRIVQLVSHLARLMLGVVVPF